MFSHDITLRNQITLFGPPRVILALVREAARELASDAGAGLAATSTLTRLFACGHDGSWGIDFPRTGSRPALENYVKYFTIGEERFELYIQTCTDAELRALRVVLGDLVERVPEVFVLLERGLEAWTIGGRPGATADEVREDGWREFDGFVEGHLQDVIPWDDIEPNVRYGPGGEELSEYTVPWCWPLIDRALGAGVVAAYQALARKGEWQRTGAGREAQRRAAAQAWLAEHRGLVEWLPVAWSALEEWRLARWRFSDGDLLYDVSAAGTLLGFLAAPRLSGTDGEGGEDLQNGDDCGGGEGTADGDARVRRGPDHLLLTQPLVEWASRLESDGETCVALLETHRGLGDATWGDVLRALLPPPRGAKFTLAVDPGRPFDALEPVGARDGGVTRAGEPRTIAPSDRGWRALHRLRGAALARSGDVNALLSPDALDATDGASEEALAVHGSFARTGDLLAKLGLGRGTGGRWSLPLSLALAVPDARAVALQIGASAESVDPAALDTLTLFALARAASEPASDGEAALRERCCAHLVALGDPDWAERSDARLRAWLPRLRYLTGLPGRVDASVVCDAPGRGDGERSACVHRGCVLEGVEVATGIGLCLACGSPLPGRTGVRPRGAGAPAPRADAVGAGSDGGAPALAWPAAFLTIAGGVLDDADGDGTPRPSQWALRIQDARDAPLGPGLGAVLPTEGDAALLEGLRACLPATGAIVVWSAEATRGWFERLRAAPDATEAIDDWSARLVELRGAWRSDTTGASANDFELSDLARARLGTAFECERLQSDLEVLEQWCRSPRIAGGHVCEADAPFVAVRDLESRADRAVLLLAALCEARCTDGVDRVGY